MKFLRSLAISFCLLGGLSILWADAPGIINYQGKLTDQNGNPITDGTGVSIVFSLYSAPTGGSPLFQENRTVPVDNGVFTVQIGSVTAGGIPKTIFQTNTSLYLGVKVGSDSEMTPRERLVAAPYALAIATNSVGANEIIDSTITLSKVDLTSFDSRYALTGGNVNTSTLTVTYSVLMATQSGRVGIGTTSPSYQLHSVSAAGASGTLFAVSTGTTDLFRVLGTSVNLKVPLVFPDGTVQASAAGGATQWTTNGSSIGYAVAGGGVGIGRTDPGAKLEIASMNGTNPLLLIASGTAASQELLRVSSNGYVGIGTTTPGSVLEVQSNDVNITPLVIRGGLGGTGADIVDIYDRSGAVRTWADYDGVLHSGLGSFSGNLDLGRVGNANSLAPTAVNQSMYLGHQSGGDTGNLIVAMPKMGIGGTPNYVLHVSSGAGMAGTVFAVSTGSVDLFRVLGTSVNLNVPLVFPDGTVQGTAAGTASQWTTNGSSIGYTTGGVGIGRTDPSAKLEVVAQLGSPALLISSGTGVNQDLIFISSQGNVGIGTTSPRGLLELNSRGQDTNVYIGSDGRISNSNGFVQFIKEGGAEIHLGTYIDLWGDVRTGNVGSFGELNLWGDTGTTIGSSGNPLRVYGDVYFSTGTAWNIFQVGGATFTALSNGRVGIGTTSPSYQLHSVSAAGTGGTLFAVSTGTTDLFRVLGTSVNLAVPLVFPDGTMQTSAASAGNFVSKTGDTMSGPLTLSGSSLTVTGAVGISSGVYLSGTGLATADPIFQVAGSTFVVTKEGRIGIGRVPNSNALLDVNMGFVGYNGAVRFVDNSNEGIQFEARTGGARITSVSGGSTGNGALLIDDFVSLGGFQNMVGIGTTVPSYRLHVSSAAGETGTLFAVSTGTTDLFRVLGTSVNLAVPLVFPDGTVQASAATASQWTTNGSSIGYTNGGVGIGRTDPGAKLEIAGLNGTKPLLLIASGTAASQELIRVSSVGWMGIGTSAPSAILDIPNVPAGRPMIHLSNTGGSDLIIDFSGNNPEWNGPLQITGGVILAGNGTVMRGGGSGETMTLTSQSGGGAILQSAGTGSVAATIQRIAGQTGSLTEWQDQGGSTLAFVDANGNMGLGASSTQYRLQVSSAAGYTGTVFAVSTGTTDLFRVLGTSVNLKVPLVFPDGTVQASAGAVGSNYVAKAGDTMSGQLTVQSSATLAGVAISSAVSLSGANVAITNPVFQVVGGTFTVLKNGSVGIGTTAPGGLLEISDGISNGSRFTTNSGGLTITNISGNSGGLRIAGASNVEKDLELFDTTNNRAWDLFHAPTTDNNNLMVDYFNGSTWSAPLLAISTMGNVGIGTSRPNYYLHVSSAAGSNATILAVSTGSVNLFSVLGTSVNLKVPLVFPDGTVQASAGAVGSNYVAKAGDTMSGQLTVQSSATLAGVAVSSAVSLSGASVAITNPVFQVVGGTFTVLKNGRVGIGKSNPLYPLDLTDSVSGKTLGQAVMDDVSVSKSGSYYANLFWDGTNVNYIANGPGYEWNMDLSDNNFHLRSYAVGTGGSAVSPGTDIMVVSSTTARLGLGTSRPIYQVQVATVAGVSNTIFAVSTGTTDLFRVLGTSVNFTVPLVFPDGTVQATAATGSVAAHASTHMDGGSDRLTGSLTLTTATLTGSNFSVGVSTLAVALGKVGIGTTAPSYQLQVTTVAGATGTFFAVSSGPVNLFSVLGTSVNLKVPLVFPDGTSQASAAGTASQWTTNGSSIGYAVAGGGVGVGRTDPGAKLEVAGLNGSKPMLIIASGTAAGQELLRVSSMGYVGIGTTTPQQKIDVVGAVIGGDGTFSTALTASGIGPSLQFGTPTSLSNLGQIGTYANTLSVDSSNGPIIFKHYSVEKMRIDPVGRVGISTGTPQYLLHVATAAGQGGTIFAVSTGSVDLFRVLGTSVNINVPLVFPDGTVQASAGAVGSNYVAKAGDTMTGQLTVQSSATFAGVAISSAVNLSGANVSAVNPVFNVVGGTFTVLKNGKVGIGTAVPAYALEIYDPGGLQKDTGMADNWGVRTSGSYYLNAYYDGAPKYQATGSAFELYADVTNNRAVFLSHPSGTINTQIAISSTVWAATMDGKMGIGTSSPLYMVQVATAAGSRGTLFSVSTGAVDLFRVLGTSVNLKVPLVFQDGSSQATAATSSQWTTNGSSIGYTGGNVGVGRTDANARLEVSGNTGSQPILILSSGTTASQELLRVSSIGYVGIGTTTPAAPLEIDNTALFSSEYDNGNSGGSATVNWLNGNKQKITLNSATNTITLSAPAGHVGNFLLKIVQDATGNRAITTWSSTTGSVKWPSGIAPALTTGGNGVDIVTFYWDGANFYGVASYDFQ